MVTNDYSRYPVVESDNSTSSHHVLDKIFSMFGVAKFVKSDHECLTDCQKLFVCCLLVGFNSQLDSYPRNIVHLPCQPGFSNSLDGGDCLHGGHYADDLAAN